MASKLNLGLRNLGIEFLNNSTTNQIFPIITNELLDKIQELYDITYWAPMGDDKCCIRLCTSWATKESAVEEFIKDVKTLLS